MGPRGRGSSRGGSRGRAGFRGRGRGRGGINRFGKRPKFDSSRVEEKEEENSEDESSSEDDEASSGSGSDEEVAPARPYVTLLRSLTENSGPGAKRRKLDRKEAPDQSSSEEEDEADSGDEQDKNSDFDRVDEPEEDPEEVQDEFSLDEDDDGIESSDPFTSHFVNPDESEVAKRIKAISQNEWASKKIASRTSRAFLMVPKAGASDEISPPIPVTKSSSLTLKPKLKESITTQRPEFDASEQSLATPLFNYYDTIYCQRTVANGENLRRLICLHALNHVFKTRDRVIKNSAKLAREDGDQEFECRDQGYTRPKVLMILPTRQSCAKMVNMICSLTDADQQENRKRFDDSYVDKDTFSDDKPADFKDVFDGNNDDMFRLGVKFTRKTIKYFAQFYNSDILIASPLGLRMAMGSEEEKNVDYDFLSSIEMVIMDQTDAIMMQNWEHVEHIFEHLNLPPKDSHGCDFSRVRSWYLDGQAQNFRQTVVLSAFNTPEISELMRSHCRNWAGRVRVQPEYTGVIQQLGVGGVRQTFSRFAAPGIAADPDARFEYFTKAIVPQLARRPKDSSGTLVFIASYADFVRVRNYFSTSPAVEALSFGTIGDYAEVAETSRAQSHFITGRHRVLLYTERAHHFRRQRLRGVRRVIFYGLPDNPVFYREIAGGYMARSEQDGTLQPGEGSVRVLFSKYDVLKLERIVGTQRVGRMLNEKGDTFEFV